MEFLHLQTQKQSAKHNKKRLTKDQVKLLERSFSSNKKLDPDRKIQLAKHLGIPPRQVGIWYQNKRARWKTQSLELDYDALQVKLEVAIAEKIKMEKELERVHGELKRTQQMLIGLNQTSSSLFPISCVSASGDDVGSSNLHEETFCWEKNHETVQLQELYACLIGTNDG